MTFCGDMLWLLIVLPAIGAALGLIMPSPRAAIRSVAIGVPVVAAVAAWAVVTVMRGGPLLSAGEWLHLDALAGYHVVVMMIVFVMSSLYAVPYFSHEPAGHELDLPAARRFAALWYGALAAMTLVMLSNNLGVMWVGVEATTLLTAFLICLRVSPSSLEATWKYLIVCSVGVAFAFMGVLLVAASAGHAAATDVHLLHWTHLQQIVKTLDPRLLKLAFIFIIVGYGTKAGLAPMHSWLPDAHSQAPAPVSAIFSGFMLNTALYCIMRYMPMVDAAWARNLLIVFGLVSIIIAAVFILAQHDLKRLLAYCSVEHLGIIALGLGLGPLGAFAALFHTLNHSVCKALSFFCAGRIGQACGTHDMREIRGSIRLSRLWGTGLFISMLALIGVAPFAIFMSELLVLKAMIETHGYISMAVFLLGTATVFVAVLRYAMNMAWGTGTAPRKDEPGSLLEWLVVVAPLALLLTLGLWMPASFRHVLEAAASIAAGRAP
ncbi:MAG: proton-conducting transporter membrane subunit [bacterium]